MTSLRHNTSAKPVAIDAYLDATYLDVRQHVHVVSQAVAVAIGVSALGRREILGMAVGDSESTDFWTEFLRSLRQRGLNPTSPQHPRGLPWSSATRIPG